MTKLRIKVGNVECEVEGSEDFVSTKLVGLMQEMGKLHPAAAAAPFQPAAPAAASGGGADTPATVDGLSVNTIAQKLKVKSAADLLMAAAYFCDLASKGSQFNSADIKKGMRDAISYYTDNHRKNFDATLKVILKKGRLNHRGGTNYSLPLEERTALTAKLNGAPAEDKAA